MRRRNERAERGEAEQGPKGATARDRRAADARPHRSRDAVQRGRRMTRSRLLVMVLGVALAAAPLVAPPFWITLGNYIGLYSIVSLGLVLLTGVAGQTSFGQAAFVGIGAYTTAYLSLNYPAISPWLNVLAGIALTALIALLLGFITLRMKGHYLPL